MARRRRTIVLSVAVFALLAALLVAISAKSAAEQRRADEARVATATLAGSSRPSTPVAVIGDSFTTGTAQGGTGAANWVSLLAASRDWAVTSTAIGGTGYVAAPPGTAPYEPAQLDAALAAGPRLVVVEGSRNDASSPPDRVGAAATALYRDLRARAPQARLVVIGPIWSDGTQPAPVRAIRDAVRDAATAAGATWIDPVADGWFARPAGLIGADGIHPTDAGHRLMAERVDAALTAAGL
ncbi:SGNH/GDSL hydrolase family protein [Actinomycetospora sp. CA-084318]|uniref:SGNH/GDSL hydrolase family protein n=1 Tax=Actinomycetospora sp. CA-084318 TaxID=3239892 RepID=UPI003D969542